jgi:hypothetical protein
MPENKGERRILRLALEKSGRVMERYGAGDLYSYVFMPVFMPFLF